MGRQLPVMMDRRDEAAFIAFLKSISEISIFESFSPSVEQLEVQSFSETRRGHRLYFVWNQKFPWRPIHAKVGTKAFNPEMIGWSYISNKSSAPVLEVSRSCIETQEPGRLYWARDFSATGPLEYDQDSFSKWIDQIWKWVRRTASKQRMGAYEPYIFPGAHSTLGPFES